MSLSDLKVPTRESVFAKLEQGVVLKFAPFDAENNYVAAWEIFVRKVNTETGEMLDDKVYVLRKEIEDLASPEKSNFQPSDFVNPDFSFVPNANEYGISKPCMAIFFVGCDLSNPMTPKILPLNKSSLIKALYAQIEMGADISQVFSVLKSKGKKVEYSFIAVPFKKDEKSVFESLCAKYDLDILQSELRALLLSEYPDFTKAYKR